MAERQQRANAQNAGPRCLRSAGSFNFISANKKGHPDIESDGLFFELARVLIYPGYQVLRLVFQALYSLYQGTVDAYGSLSVIF